jgi:hypothetical protein
MYFQKRSAEVLILTLIILIIFILFIVVDNKKSKDKSVLVQNIIRGCGLMFNLFLPNTFTLLIGVFLVEPIARHIHLMKYKKCLKGKRNGGNAIQWEYLSRDAVYGICSNLINCINYPTNYMYGTFIYRTMGQLLYLAVQKTKVLNFFPNFTEPLFANHLFCNDVKITLIPLIIGSLFLHYDLLKV